MAEYGVGEVGRGESVGGGFCGIGRFEGDNHCLELALVVYGKAVD